jgi:hypothetical protein
MSDIKKKRKTTKNIAASTMAAITTTITTMTTMTTTNANAATKPSLFVDGIIVSKKRATVVMKAESKMKLMTKAAKKRKPTLEEVEYNDNYSDGDNNNIDSDVDFDDDDYDIDRVSTPRSRHWDLFFMRDVHRKSFARRSKSPTEYSKTEVENC